MDFSRIGFTGEEINRILRDIPGSPLKELDLSIVNLSFSSGDLLARAVGSLQSVNLWFTHLTTDQSIGVLEACRSSSTITDVNLMHLLLSEVPAEILSSGISRLQSVNLEGTSLTNDQSLKLVAAILSSDTLVNVNLTQVCLNQVPADLLAQAICPLATIHLYDTKLTTCQCVQVLEAILSSSTLVSVDLGYVDLSGVPPSLVARAASQLETAKLWGSNLTTEQCVSVLSSILSSTTLANLSSTTLANLSSTPLANLSSTTLANLSSTTLANLSSTTLANLSSTTLANLSSTTLANLSSTTLANLSSTTLANLNLQQVNLGGVPAELLARAVCKLKYVSLEGTNLTMDQCIQVVDAISSSTICQRAHFTSTP